LTFELPPRENGGPSQWRRWIDTGLESPLDIVPWRSATAVSESVYQAYARSVVVLIGDMPLPRR
jgi:isoamylase